MLYSVRLRHLRSGRFVRALVEARTQAGAVRLALLKIEAGYGAWVGDDPPPFTLHDAWVQDQIEEA